MRTLIKILLIATVISVLAAVGYFGVPVAIHYQKLALQKPDIDSLNVVLSIQQRDIDSLRYAITEQELMIAAKDMQIEMLTKNSTWSREKINQLLAQQRELIKQQELRIE